MNCPSTFGARYRAHNAYTRVVQSATGRLNLITSYREPKTTSVLLDEFTYDECRALCPKILTAEKSALAVSFHQTMLDLAGLQVGEPGQHTVVDNH